MLRAIGRAFPVYVVTGRTSHREAEQARALGAAKVLEKPVQDLDWLVRESFMQALGHRFRGFAGDWVNARKVMEALLREDPESVDMWAAGVPCHCSYLRRVWEQAGLRARHVQKLHRLYRLAFDYLCSVEHGIPAPAAAAEELLRLLDYLDTHRSEMMALLPDQASC